MSTIVVTGVSGYIGGQTALLLKDAGERVIGIDRRPLPSHLKSVCDRFVQEDFSSKHALSVIVQERPDAIVHCAGTSLVGPSVKDPAVYYENNVVNTFALLEIVRRAMPRTKFVYSSSAATYGEPVMLPIHEVDPAEPVSPYGQSKLMIDMMLESYHRAYGLDYVSFRYFNACGADPKARHGQEPGATHIIARVLEAIRDNQEFTLYGNNYPTADGTCVRDYVHVDDIARAHSLAIYHDIPAGVYNLGSSTGTSNQEIIDAAKRITGQSWTVTVGEQRAGDPPQLTASSAKFDMVAGAWRHYELDDMIKHAWAWYVQ
jgi:UDP-glucose-4-epimerase GalE